MFAVSWMRAGRAVAVAAAVMTVARWSAGCASTKETAERDTLTANVGNYDPAPAGITKPRVGVPLFSVKGEGASAGLNEVAADQMTTLLDATERFNVIERAQLEKLLDEQDLEGIIGAGEMAKSARVRGIDYLLLGRVTNLRVKNESTSRGFGLAQVGGLLHLGGADVQKKDVKITTECGVDIRLVDPTTGEVVMSNFSEYKKTDSAGALGLDILGASANADADIEIDEDDKGKILRLALDDALRKSIKKIDRFLATPRAADDSGNDHAPAAAAPVRTAAPKARPAAPARSAVAPAPAAATPAPAAAGAKKFCGECGKQRAAGAKFCPSCGAAVQ